MNTLICGDCIEQMETMDTNSVHLVLTDIPYNEVNRPSGGIQCHGYTIRYNHGEADGADFDLPATLNEMWRVCKGSFYIFCGIGQISTISNFFRGKGVNTRLIIYEKTNPLPVNGKHIWLSGIETAVFAKKGGATFNLDCCNTVLRYPIAQPTGHPTPKPLNLMRELIRASSNEGDIVLDPFMGGVRHRWLRRWKTENISASKSTANTTTSPNAESKKNYSNLNCSNAIIFFNP